MVVHLWAELEGSIDGFIEGTGKLLGEVLGAEEAADFRLSLDGSRCLVASLMWGP